MKKKSPNLLYEALLINICTSSTHSKEWLSVSTIRSRNKTNRNEGSPYRWFRIPEQTGKLPEDHVKP